MKKKLLALLLILLVAFTVFAESSNVSILLGSKVNFVEKKLDVKSAYLNLSEIAYYNQNGKDSSPFFRFDAGAEMFINDSDKPMIGLNGGAYIGYSLGVGPLAKLEVAGGVEFFESSVIEYLIKKTAKDDSYKITGYIAPAVDLSIFLGLDQVSIRAGLRGSFGIAKNFANGLHVEPYIGISAKLLQFLNIL